MGNDLDAGFRGDTNVELTEVINKLSDDEFEAYLK